MFAQTGRLNLNFGAGKLRLSSTAEQLMELDSNIEKLDLIKKNDYYISENFDNTSQKLYFDINMGVGNIAFHTNRLLKTAATII